MVGARARTSSRLRIGLLVLALMATTAAGTVFDDERAVEAIHASLPEGWSRAESKLNEVPYGHHWGQSYDGPTGRLEVFAGPKERSINWKDEAGSWHREVVGKEALQVWIMPADYKRSWWRFLKPKGPVPAGAVYSDDAIRIFANESIHVSRRERFEEILELAVETNWSGPEDDERELTWTNWKEDLRRGLGEMRPSGN